MAFKAGEGGRPLGARNKATKDLIAALDAIAVDRDGVDTHAQRLHDLTQSADEHVAMKALTLVMAYRYGKPQESVEVSVPEPVTIRYVTA